MAEQHTEQRADKVARETARKAADQATRSAEAMSHEAERTARASAETMQRNSDRFMSSWRSSADAASQIAERSFDKWSSMFGLTGESTTEAIQQSSSNMQAMLDTTAIMASGLQDLSGEWLQFAQRRTEQNLEHVDRLIRCRTLQECMASQTQIARDTFQAFLESVRRTTERSTQLMDEAVRKMGEAPLAPR
jgi:phasin family protein